jgi:hypothetical protein
MGAAFIPTEDLSDIELGDLLWFSILAVVS